MSKAISNPQTYSVLPPLPSFPTTPDYLTTDEVAQILRVTKETLRLYIKAGRIRASKIGRAYLVLRTEVDKFVQSLAKGGSQNEKA